MLDLARPDYDSLKPIPVLFPDVIRDVIGALTPMARRAGVTLETNIDPEASEVLADHRLLKQALINLVRNAIQALASTPGPQVVIGTRPNGTRVEIDVADNGPGVPATIFDDIFTTFTTTKFTGTGLGLSICRNAVSMMGGTIDYVTPRGRSQAVFRISLPKPPSTSKASFPDYAPASRHFTEASAG
jgi:two-component system sensor kinase FixL